MKSDEIPVAHTPPGLGRELPPPVLAGCTEPLVAGAPDLRGTRQLFWEHGPLMTTWMEQVAS